MDLEKNAILLCEYFASTKPFLIGRNGTVELEVLLSKDIPNILANKLELHAGVFPSSHAESWRLDYLDAIAYCDVIAEGWYKPLAEREKALHDSLNPKRKSILLRNLEPYYVAPELRWTSLLAGKRVAIINSFAVTCEEQTYMAKALWSDSESLLPDSTTWIPIQTYYGPLLANGNAEWPNATNYREAIQDIVERTIMQKAEVAIIGCGGLGMIIGSELKKNGPSMYCYGRCYTNIVWNKGKAMAEPRCY